jgi:DNA adenine methylase
MTRLQPLLSPLKYPGGKRKLFAEVEKRLPSGSFKYAEPFFGGGSIGVRLAGEGRLVQLVAGEACGPVRAFWEQLVGEGATFDAEMRQRGPLVQQVIEVDMQVLLCTDPIKLFEGRRHALNSGEAEPARLGALLYALNKTCMNGLVRFNSRGEFNVPIGRRQDGSFYRFQPDYEHLDRVRAALVGAGFQIFPSWRAVTELVMHSDGDPSQWAIYFDPPYTGGFVDYTAEGWTSDDDIELYEAARELGAVREHVILSQPDTEWARDCCAQLLKGWQVDSLGVGRPVNSDGEGRGPVGELLIWNKPVERVTVPVDIDPRLRADYDPGILRVTVPAQPAVISVNITTDPISEDNGGGLV